MSANKPILEDLWLSGFVPFSANSRETYYRTWDGRGRINQFRWWLYRRLVRLAIKIRPPVNAVVTVTVDTGV